MPTYNGSKWISRAINSIKAQSYTDWELLVVDDGSTDNTGSIIKDLALNDHRIKYIKNDQNMGIQRSLNRGLREAMGEYIARLDDDDIWCDTEKLAKQVEFLDGNPDHIIVGTGVVMLNENGKELFRYLLPESDKTIKSRILGKNCFVHSSVVFRKDVVLSVGGYGEGEDALHFEDYDLWLRIGSLGKFANLPIYATAYTVRESSLSAVNRLYVFKKLLSHLKKHKGQYNNYYINIILAYFRYFAYSLYLKIHKTIPIDFFIKIYKEI
jgi:glycosyltransferase involved in cell wall biosynthesis